MGKKKKILTKKVYSRITPENYKRLETIASKYGFKSVYEIVQSLIHCFLPKKVKQLEELIQTGYSINIMSDIEFIQLLKTILQ